MLADQRGVRRERGLRRGGEAERLRAEQERLEPQPAVDRTVDAEVGLGRDDRDVRSVEEVEVAQGLLEAARGVVPLDPDAGVELVAALAAPVAVDPGIARRERKSGPCGWDITCAASAARNRSVAAPVTTSTRHGWVLHHDGVRCAVSSSRSTTTSSGPGRGGTGGRCGARPAGGRASRRTRWSRGPSCRPAEIGKTPRRRAGSPTMDGPCTSRRSSVSWPPPRCWRPRPRSRRRPSPLPRPSLPTRARTARAGPRPCRQPVWLARRAPTGRTRPTRSRAGCGASTRARRTRCGDPSPRPPARSARRWHDRRAPPHQVVRRVRARHVDPPDGHRLRRVVAGRQPRDARADGGLPDGAVGGRGLHPPHHPGRGRELSHLGHRARGRHRGRPHARRDAARRALPALRARPRGEVRAAHLAHRPSARCRTPASTSTPAPPTGARTAPGRSRRAARRSSSCRGSSTPAGSRSTPPTTPGRSRTSTARRDPRDPARRRLRRQALHRRHREVRRPTMWPDIVPATKKDLKNNARTCSTRKMKRCVTLGIPPTPRPPPTRSGGCRRSSAGSRRRTSTASCGSARPWLFNQADPFVAQRALDMVPHDAVDGHRSPLSPPLVEERRSRVTRPRSRWSRNDEVVSRDPAPAGRERQVVSRDPVPLVEERRSRVTRPLPR